MKTLRRLSPAGFVVLALLGACFSPGTASGQDSKGRSRSWDNLKSLTPGQEIRVEMNNVKSYLGEFPVVMNNVKYYQGEFESLSDNGITLRQTAGEQTLARKDVLRISWKGQNHRTRNAVIGAVVGAGAGLGIGLAANNVIWSHANCYLGVFYCDYPPNPHWEIIGPPVVALAGAAIGAVIPSSGGWHEVYRAR